VCFRVHPNSLPRKPTPLLVLPPKKGVLLRKLLPITPARIGQREQFFKVRYPNLRLISREDFRLCPLIYRFEAYIAQLCKIAISNPAYDRVLIRQIVMDEIHGNVWFLNLFKDEGPSGGLAVLPRNLRQLIWRAFPRGRVRVPGRHGEKL